MTSQDDYIDNDGRGVSIITRAEFDAKYAATLDSTEGFSQNDLDQINAEVFGQIDGLNTLDGSTEDKIKRAFELASDRR